MPAPHSATTTELPRPAPPTAPAGMLPTVPLTAPTLESPPRAPLTARTPGLLLSVPPTAPTRETRLLARPTAPTRGTPLLALRIAPTPARLLFADLSAPTAFSTGVRYSLSISCFLFLLSPQLLSPVHRIAQCPQTSYAHTTWPVTLVGRTAIGVCDVGYQGTPTRVCVSNATWASTVGSQCTGQSNTLSSLLLPLKKKKSRWLSFFSLSKFLGRFTHTYFLIFWIVFGVFRSCVDRVWHLKKRKERKETKKLVNLLDGIIVVEEETLEKMEGYLLAPPAPISLPGREGSETTL